MLNMSENIIEIDFMVLSQYEMSFPSSLLYLVLLPFLPSFSESRGGRCTRRWRCLILIQVLQIQSIRGAQAVVVAPCLAIRNHSSRLNNLIFDIFLLSFKTNPPKHISCPNVQGA